MHQTSSRYIKGKNYELLLARKLVNYGFFVVRAPASGRRGKKLRYVDVIAIKSGRVLLFEVRYFKKLVTIYIPKNVYEKLRRARDVTGGEAYFALYIGELKEWRFIPIDKVQEQTDKYVKIGIDMLRSGYKVTDIVYGRVK